MDFESTLPTLSEIAGLMQNALDRMFEIVESDEESGWFDNISDEAMELKTYAHALRMTVEYLNNRLRRMAKEIGFLYMDIIARESNTTTVKDVVEFLFRINSNSLILESIVESNIKSRSEMETEATNEDQD